MWWFGRFWISIARNFKARQHPISSSSRILIHEKKHTHTKQYNNWKKWASIGPRQRGCVDHDERGCGDHNEPPPQLISSIASKQEWETIGFYHHGTIFHGTLGSFHPYVASSTCIVGCNGFGSLLDVPLLGPLIHIFNQTRKIQ